MDNDPIRQRLLRLLRRNRTDLRNASLAVGRNPAYLHQFVSRGTPRILPEDVRERLAALLGVDDSELRHSFVPAHGRSPSHRGSAPPPKQSEIRIARPSDGGRAKRISLRGGKKTPGSGVAVPEGFVAVAEMDVRASAGPGAVHDGPEEASAVWLFPEAVVRHEIRARPDDLRVITVDGDSMEPLLASGDRILVDTSQRRPVPPGVFVIWDGMGLVAKRIEHVPNSEPAMVVLRSVNPEYASYERAAEEVSIVGRVVWAARRL